MKGAHNAISAQTQKIRLSHTSYPKMQHSLVLLREIDATDSLIILGCSPMNALNPNFSRQKETHLPSLAQPSKAAL